MTGSLAAGIVCVAAYACARRVARIPLPRSVASLASPVLVGTALVCIVAPLCHLGAAALAPVAHLAAAMLVPATMAIALPVFRTRATLGRHAVLAVIALTAGSFAGISTAFVLARAFGLNPSFAGILEIKSATAAVSLDLASRHGIDPVATSAIVVATGLFGAVCGPLLLALARVRHPVARGLAYGATSHAIGTARAIGESELTGAVAGVALCLSGVLIAAVGPFALRLTVGR